jgi:hypothetical protein
MVNPRLDEAITVWASYRKIHPKSTLLPLLAADLERNRIDNLANKIKMNQWTDEQLPDQVYDDFVSSVFRWRDIVTLDILQHGSI